MVRLEYFLRAWNCPKLAISIPKWYDWSYSNLLSSRLAFNISIPKWYDWSSEILKEFIVHSSISIPKWYDWSQAYLLHFGYIWSFQFLNGTIGVF